MACYRESFTYDISHMPIQNLYVNIQGFCHYHVHGIFILEVCYSMAYKFGTSQFSEFMGGEEVK
jgi:hypothetical protein